MLDHSQNEQAEKGAEKKADDDDYLTCQVLSLTQTHQVREVFGDILNVQYRNRLIDVNRHGSLRHDWGSDVWNELTANPFIASTFICLMKIHASLVHRTLLKEVFETFFT